MCFSHRFGARHTYEKRPRYIEGSVSDSAPDFTLTHSLCFEAKLVVSLFLLLVVAVLADTQKLPHFLRNICIGELSLDILCFTTLLMRPTEAKNSGKGGKKPGLGQIPDSNETPRPKAFF